MPSLIQWLPRPHRVEPDETNFCWTFYDPSGTSNYYSLIIKKENINV